MNTIEKTNIQGLYWKKNYYVGTGIRSYTLVANEGPIVTDVFFFEDDTHYKNFYLHIGQIDRFTFIGNENQTITAEFIDCRENSPTLHQKLTMEFTPDPRKHLVIERGIAKRFLGLKNTTIRSEPILFATNENNGYIVGNDRLIFSEKTNAKEFPKVNINKLPLPKEALQFLLKKEQEVLKTGEKPPFSYKAYIDGELRRIQMKPTGN